MNKRQALRIAMAVEASYILFGAKTDCITQSMHKADVPRFYEAQEKMAWDLLRKAGFDQPMQPEEIVAAVLER